MDAESLSSILEAMLFTADHPVPITRFREAFGENAPTEEEIKAALDLIKEKYQDKSRGFDLREAQGGYHFCTKTENAEWVRRFLSLKPFRLGRSSMETLAIVAYKQPITRAEIDQVRGMDSSHLLRVLVERGIVRMTGKADIPGRPVQYGTTPKFLEIVGLSSLAELPPLSELEQLQGNTEEPVDALEANLDKFMDDSVMGAVSSMQPAGDEAELGEIDTLIHSTDRADDEVYASPLHAEIAKENKEAVAAYQAFSKKSRKKSPPPPTPEPAVEEPIIEVVPPDNAN